MTHFSKISELWHIFPKMFSWFSPCYNNAVWPCWTHTGWLIEKVHVHWNQYLQYQRVSGGLFRPPPPPYFGPYSFLQTLKDVLQKFLFCPPYPPPKIWYSVLRTDFWRYSVLRDPPDTLIPRTIPLVATPFMWWNVRWIAYNICFFRPFCGHFWVKMHSFTQ